ncbi:MarR family winged helix-turn-helix transcriptional regulator [Paraoerskovia marina]|uniref:MarR family protein n=1 Tax=Paraoerskovia marina TaxID=545619 RepID=A0A1H1NCC1_9CELL|nr:MarR family transcriptional regulator [Paraoerskovia marina]SDR96616.1 MarR family protein [Paraoerskovia marina]
MSEAGSTGDVVADRRLEALVGVDVPLQQLKVLALLKLHGVLTAYRIGELLDSTPSTVTGIVQRLESSGLVARLPHPTDGRVSNILATPAGEEIVDALVD